MNNEGVYLPGKIEYKIGIVPPEIIDPTVATEPEPKLFLYPPTAVTDNIIVNTSHNFTGEISGDGVGSGTYTIELSESLSSYAPLGRLYDKRQGRTWIEKISIDSQDVTFTFTFPLTTLIIRQEVYMSNSTRANCDIIINNITLFTGSIDDTSADVKIDLPHHNQISQSVQIRLYGGSKVYTQNSEFYFYGYDNANIIQESIPEPEPDDSWTFITHTNGTVYPIYIVDELTSNKYNSVISSSDIKEVHIGKNVTSIDSIAFQGCSALQIVIIPNSITSINDVAFQNSGLKVILIFSESPLIGSSITSFWIPL